MEIWLVFQWNSFGTIEVYETFGLRNIRKRILVVEDDISMQKLVDFHLKDIYDVSVVSDGWDAINALNQDLGFDLILTDIEMPELSGLKLIEILDDIPGLSRIPVIIMSSLICDSIKLDLELSNYYGCLQKPIVPAEMYLRIEEAFVSKIG